MPLQDLPCRLLDAYKCLSVYPAVNSEVKHFNKRRHRKNTNQLSGLSGVRMHRYHGKSSERESKHRDDETPGGVIRE